MAEKHLLVGIFMFKVSMRILCELDPCELSQCQILSAVHPTPYRYFLSAGDCVLELMRLYIIHDAVPDSFEEIYQVYAVTSLYSGVTGVKNTSLFFFSELFHLLLLDVVSASEFVCWCASLVARS